VSGEAGLIDAIAVAIAQALAAHGVTPAEGNMTVHTQCARLCAEWGGEEHWLPKTYRTGKAAQVADAVANGATLAEAARRAGVHRDTARRLVKRQSAGLGREDWVL
jgi:hypothetical protein